MGIYKCWFLKSDEHFSSNKRLILRHGEVERYWKCSLLKVIYQNILSPVVKCPF